MGCRLRLSFGLLILSLSLKKVNLYIMCLLKILVFHYTARHSCYISYDSERLRGKLLVDTEITHNNRQQPELQARKQLNQCKRPHTHTHDSYERSFAALHQIFRTVAASSHRFCLIRLWCVAETKHNTITDSKGI